MKKRFPRKQFPGKNLQQARTAMTGEHCPLSGWWSPDNFWWLPDNLEREKLFIAEGSIMPPYEGKPVLWTVAGIDVAEEMSEGWPPRVSEQVR